MMASAVGQSVEMYHTAFLRTVWLPLAPAGHVTHLGRRGTERKFLAEGPLFMMGKEKRHLVVVTCISRGLHRKQQTAHSK